MPSITPNAGQRGYLTINTGSATHLIITAGAGTGQYRLTKGPHTGFQTGDGVPQVIIRDPEQTLQRVTPDDIRADINVTIEETG